MKPAYRHPLFWLGVACSLLGVGLFIVLFVPIFNVFWLVLAPVILAVYQLPALFVFRAWKRRTERPTGGNEGDAGGGAGEDRNAPDGI